MATIITKTVFTSGGFYNSDNKLVFIKEKHNKNETYYKIERSKVEPYDYDKLKINKAFYESAIHGGVYKDGVTTIERK